jgi:CMP/dCMP kinase
MAVITISREAGSGGDEIARRVCELLDYRYVDKGMLDRVAQEEGLSETELVDFSEDSYRGRGFVDVVLRRSTRGATIPTRASTADEVDAAPTRTLDEATAAGLVAGTIRALQNQGRVVVVGRGGQAILRGQPGVLHARIVAQYEDRVMWMMQDLGLPREVVAGWIAERDRANEQYLRRFHAVDWTDPTLYHLTLNVSLLGQEKAAELIAAAASSHGQLGHRAESS